jgi:kumamolisin
MLVHKQGNVDEVAWWTSPGYRDGGGGATGGGVSTVFPRPPWQNVRVPSINPRSIDGRVVPDVAALAGPPFFDLMFRGRDHPNGGTSCSAPMWAALIARIYAHVGSAKRRFFPAWLYHDDAAGTPHGASVCRDIVKGQNASKPDPGHGYEAGPGYDAVTGWGVPDGKAIAAAL